MELIEGRPLKGPLAPDQALEELAQNGVRRDQLLNRLEVRAAPFALS
jgi:hypothetical protein